MSLGLIAVFDREFPHEQPAGELVLSVIDLLADLAEVEEVRPLSSFHGWAHIEMPEGYEDDPRELWVGPPHWSDPAELLRTLETLCEHMPANLRDPSGDEVVEELQAFAEALRAAIAAGARVYLDTA